MFGQFTKNEYIRGSCSVLLQTMNIFNICIWSAVGLRIYSKFVFSKIFHMFLFIDGQQKSLGIFVFSQVSKNEYIRYSYSVMYLLTNIFDICIRSGCQTRIYSIFIFGLFSKNEYIRYSYSFRYLGTNIFDIGIRSGCKKQMYSIFVFG